MRIASRRSLGGGIVAITFATAFAGCECSMNAGTPPQTPATTQAPPVNTANPPPPAPLPPSLRAKLAQHPDGGS